MSVEKRAEAIVVLADKAPPALKPYLKKAAPVIAKIITVGEQCVPYVTLAYTKCLAAYELIQPYHPEDFLPILAGLVMCFFGGVFPLLIAAIEVLRATVVVRLLCIVSSELFDVGACDTSGRADAPVNALPRSASSSKHDDGSSSCFYDFPFPIRSSCSRIWFDIRSRGVPHDGV